jgi:hypothetical protein
VPRERTRINVPFGAGVEEKADPRALATGQWAIIRNAQFTKRGSLRQRSGYAATSKSVAGGGGLTIGGPIQNLSVFRDSLVSVDTNSFLSAKQATAAGDLWSRSVRIADASIRRTQVEDTALGQNTPDVASNGSYVVRTWMNNMSGTFPNQYGDIYVSVHDAVTGATVTQPTLIFGLCTGAKIAIVGSVCMIVAWSALGSVYRYVSTSLGTAPTFTTSVNLPVTNAPDTIYGFTFDWIALSDRFVIAYQPATDNGIQLESFSTLAVSLNTRKLTDANADGTLCIAMTKDGSDNVYLAYESSDTVSIFTGATAKLSNALVVSYGPTSLPAGIVWPALPYYLSLLLLELRRASWWCLRRSGTTATSGVYCQLLNPATGGVLGSTIFTPGIVHVTRPFFFGSTAYVVASLNTTIDAGHTSAQPTFFVLDIGSTSGAAHGSSGGHDCAPHCDLRRPRNQLLVQRLQQRQSLHDAHQRRRRRARARWAQQPNAGRHRIPRQQFDAEWVLRGLAPRRDRMPDGVRRAQGVRVRVPAVSRGRHGGDVDGGRDDAGRHVPLQRRLRIHRQRRPAASKRAEPGNLRVVQQRIKYEPRHADGALAANYREEQ